MSSTQSLHSLAFRVMRLCRPTFHAETPLRFDLSDLIVGEDLFDDPSAGPQLRRLIQSQTDSSTDLTYTDRFLLRHDPSDAMGLPGMLVLPQSFGAIYLGETFCSYISINNSSSFEVRDIIIKAEIQTERQRILLLDTTKTPVETIRAGGRYDFIVEHDVKELGAHTLVCTAQYSDGDAERKYLPQYFKFMVSNPLSVRTKVTEMTYLEACLENNTKSNLYMDQVDFEPTSNWSAILLRADSHHSEKSVTTREIFKPPILIKSGGGIHNYLYQLKSLLDGSAPMKFEGSNVLGKLQITWRTNLGEPGRLQTQQIVGNLFTQREIELKAAKVPSVIILEKPFTVYLSLTNLTENKLGPFEVFISRSDSQEEKSLLGTGLKKIALPQVEAFRSLDFQMNLIPLEAGMQKISGITVFNTTEKKSYDPVPDIESLITVIVMSSRKRKSERIAIKSLSKFTNTEEDPIDLDTTDQSKQGRKKNMKQKDPGSDSDLEEEKIRVKMRKKGIALTKDVRLSFTTLWLHCFANGGVFRDVAYYDSDEFVGKDVDNEDRGRKRGKLGLSDTESDEDEILINLKRKVQRQGKKDDVPGKKRGHGSKGTEGKEIWKCEMKKKNGKKKMYASDSEDAKSQKGKEKMYASDSEDVKGQKGKKVMRQTSKKVDATDGSGTKRWMILNTRSSPAQLFRCVKLLRDNQKRGVMEMGFGNLLKFNMDGIPSKMAHFVVDRLKCKRMEIICRGGCLKITPQLIHKQIVEKIESSEDENTFDFKMDFIVLFMAVLVECHKNGRVKEGILRYITSQTDFSEIDWCDYIFECLRSCKIGWARDDNSSPFNGPLTILTLIYVEGFECKGISVDKRIHPIEFWNKNRLKIREDWEMKHGGFGRGKLNQNFVDEGSSGEREEPYEKTELLAGVKKCLDDWGNLKSVLEKDLTYLIARDKNNEDIQTVRACYESLLEKKPKWVRQLDDGENDEDGAEKIELINAFDRDTVVDLNITHPDVGIEDNQFDGASWRLGVSDLTGASTGKNAKADYTGAVSHLDNPVFLSESDNEIIKNGGPVDPTKTSTHLDSSMETEQSVNQFCLSLLNEAPLQDVPGKSNIKETNDHVTRNEENRDGELQGTLHMKLTEQIHGGFQNQAAPDLTEQTVNQFCLSLMNDPPDNDLTDNFDVVQNKVDATNIKSVEEVVKDVEGNREEAGVNLNEQQSVGLLNSGGDGVDLHGPNWSLGVSQHFISQQVDQTTIDYCLQQLNENATNEVDQQGDDNMPLGKKENLDNMKADIVGGVSKTEDPHTVGEAKWREVVDKFEANRKKPIRDKGIAEVNKSPYVIREDESILSYVLYEDSSNKGLFTDGQKNDKGKQKETLNDANDHRQSAVVNNQVIDAWVEVLNFEEKYRSPNSPYRLFCGSNVIIDGMLNQDDVDPNQRVDKFATNMNGVIAGVIKESPFAKDKADVNNLKMFDMVLFPILEFNHYYLLVFELKNCAISVIDNFHESIPLVGVKDSADYYLKDSPCKVKEMFVRYLEKIKHAKTDEIHATKIQKVQIPWATKTNAVDCGVFLMRHMEKFMGIHEQFNCGFSTNGKKKSAS
ncbi:hypothetical protein E3N88_33407 [Mikania micrantha]|uniref:Ubiquitin-like protease family profile domain-containing protein n=1 Tax=Mikania micrantha TaxID=192012 RepID=A0A5N6MBV7_9ASTR|nr:hypothetical protein E3N88_33407 [Mikania micrantha]